MIEINNSKIERFENLILNSLQKLDRTLLSKEIVIKKTRSNDSIAYTDSNKEIYLNIKLIKQKVDSINTDSKKIEFIAILKALNLHEIGHILYTDYTYEDYDILRYNSNNKNKIWGYNKNKIWGYNSVEKLREIINILEDGRLENNLSLEYPICKKYFKHIFIRFFKEHFKSDDSLKDLDRCYKLALRFLSTNYTSEIEFKSMGNSIYKNFNDNFKNSSKIKDLVKKYISNESQQDKNTRFQTAILIYQEINKVLEKEKTKEEKQQEKNKNGQKEENPKEKQIKKEIEENLNKQLQKILSDSQESLNTDSDLNKQLINIKEQLKNNNEGILKNSVALNKIVKEFKTEILKLKNKETKTPVRFQKKGYFNSNDFIKNFSSGDIRKIKTSFHNRQNLNKNNTDINLSLLLDSSGSVSNTNYQTQIETAYIISKSLEELKNQCHIIEFSDLHRDNPLNVGFITIKPFNKKTDSMNFNRSFHFGTNLIQPLNYAYENLKKQNKQNNYIIVLTDGDIPKEHLSLLEQLCLKIKKDNIEIHLILIGRKQKDITPYFNSVLEITDFKDILPQLKSLILNIQRNLIK